MLCVLSVHTYVIAWRAGDPSQNRKRPLHYELNLDPNMRTTRLLRGRGGEERGGERVEWRKEREGGRGQERDSRETTQRPRDNKEERERESLG